MIVSWNWLKDYVPLDMPAEELEHRLAMAGLNHEGSQSLEDDLAIDLEVTSNRPDCLGHVGVAREVAVLWDKPLTVPDPAPKESSSPVASLTNVTIESPDLCPRYTARLIRGVKVGPSPDWLVKRLETMQAFQKDKSKSPSINNVVDITNYVMLECGQPLHAFDFSTLKGGRIIVREAVNDEPFVAINHQEYKLRPGMCVIADESRPVALGGVMGGADTEVGDQTTDVLIEAADFAPLSIRSTARLLRLHSDSSYRFERGVDPAGIDWASRRACEMILDLAGGELAEGVVDAQPKPAEPRQPVVLRYSQLKRILGIDLERDEVLRILEKLGLQATNNNEAQATFRVPSWRRDLHREIDLVEEVARIHGYDRIPEDVSVPMAPSHRRDTDRVLQNVRQVLLASGFSEAMTASVVNEQKSDEFSPWTSAAPIRCRLPMLRGANCLRRSLVPSLLESRRVNESLANETIELFETAKIYLPREGQLPDEQMMLSLTSGQSFLYVKGVLEKILESLKVSSDLQIEQLDGDFLQSGESCRMKLNGELFGFLGAVGQKGLKSAGLRNPTTVAEVRLALLPQLADLVPQYRVASPFPAITYDFNFIVDEAVRWADLSSTVRAAGGEFLEQLDYRETYRDAKRDGAGRKRLLLSIRLRSQDQTMTGDQADAVRRDIITACQSKHAASVVE